uniref:ATP synthase CF0 subunit II n=1 Tax=Nitophyllum punctatum TaxID=158729 RepID=A0A4D6WYH9_9FLOR|nr:ATP synthase CF0 subunit II [Nitophyllum punctatum]
MDNLLSSFIIQAITKEHEGGLFDFNATLPLMALQFLVLTILLNFLFYKPISNILDQRSEYIRNSLTSASASLLKANELTSQYENKLAESRKDAQNIIKQAQQEAQLLVSNKIKDAQKNAENLLANAYQELSIQKEQALKSLENQVDMLSNQIRLKVLDN